MLRFDFSRVEVLPDYAALRRKFNAECRNGLRIFMSYYASQLGLLAPVPEDDAAEALATIDGSLSVDLTMLSYSFNMERFFQPAFFPLSLYYLGMVTFLNEFRLGFPNLSVRTLCTEYFNELEDISVSDGYTGCTRNWP